MSVETHHAVFMEVWLDRHVRDVDIILEGRAPHHVDTGIEDISQVIDLRI